MKWKELWLKLFGTTKFKGIDMGFWVSLVIIILIAIIMNIVFWNIKPKKDEDKKKDNI